MHYINKSLIHLVRLSLYLGEKSEKCGKKGRGAGDNINILTATGRPRNCAQGGEFQQQTSRRGGPEHHKKILQIYLIAEIQINLIIFHQKFNMFTRLDGFIVKLKKNITMGKKLQRRLMLLMYNNVKYFDLISLLEKPKELKENKLNVCLTSC